MYYVCKFSDSWILYDGIKLTSRNLEKAEADCLKKLFTSVLEDNKMLLAIKVNSIQPNKLMKVPVGNKESVAQKPHDKFSSNQIDAGEKKEST